MRFGLVARNPFHKRYWPNSRIAAQYIEKGDFTDPPQGMRHISSTAKGFPMIGESGMGKSVAFEIVLSCFPQVIIHSNFEGKRFPFTQIVYLIVECPPDGSLVELARAFFTAVDKAIGSDYEHDYMRPKATQNQLLANIHTVSVIHGIGSI